MNYKAVIFDLDGTLLDSLEDIAVSMNSVLIRSGFPPHPVASYRGFIGEGIGNLVKRVLPEGHRDDSTLQQHVSGMLEEYGRRWSENTRPYSGIPELLDALTHRKVRMAVLSNKMHDFTKKMVAALLAAWQFDYVVGAQAALPQKPDPAGALLIAGKSGIRAEEFLYLGDSHIDMKTARSAGMYPAGALWGFQTADELIAGGARVLLKKPLELLELFEKVNRLKG